MQHLKKIRFISEAVTNSSLQITKQECLSLLFVNTCKVALVTLLSKKSHWKTRH